MKIEIEEGRLKELERHSAMLGQIANLVEEFCANSETTTFEAVEALFDAYTEERTHADRYFRILSQAKESGDLPENVRF
jgi:hypothetical protein